MPSARLKFKLPGGPSSISIANPDDEFRILATHPTVTELRVILQVRTSDTDVIIRQLDDAQWLPSYDVLHVDEQTLLVEYALGSLPSLYQAILSSGNMLQFPIELRDGWMVCDIITSHERLSKLKDALEEESAPYEIGSVMQSTEPVGLLTDRQQRFLVEAVKRGYYDSPRQCTLTELADGMDVSKSAASGILHRAEGLILKYCIDLSV
ncbi:helix-turn-helix domain-containing protein (plasmid) [Salinigranum rubrum]|uniref:Helix-turn-helix domain-containing protein n=1 Tax=Salinigranum rubrum TaxID=755307 RepID=A0A2I8VQ77_9EURY|nr:helix-turn-helix domain-containing protein [Salinigranum rubrum]AUV84090.1 helix-turn-helix domain-containing protein [Salinigranum rubrum]